MIIIALEWFSSVMIMVMMLLTFVDVVGRYVFSEPVFGASEMVSALLALVIFSGLGICNARDDHIVVELFDGPIRRLMPGMYDFVIQIFSICGMSLVAFVLFELALEAYHHEARTFVLEWPTYYTVGAVSFLAALSVVSQIAGVVLILNDPDRGEVKTVS